MLYTYTYTFLITKRNIHIYLINNMKFILLWNIYILYYLFYLTIYNFFNYINMLWISFSISLFLLWQKVCAWCAKYVRVLKSITCWISNCSTASRNCVPQIAFNCPMGCVIQSEVLMGIGLRGNRLSSANMTRQFLQSTVAANLVECASTHYWAIDFIVLCNQLKTT